MPRWRHRALSCPRLSPEAPPWDTQLLSNPLILQMGTLRPSLPGPLLCDRKVPTSPGPPSWPGFGSKHTTSVLLLPGWLEAGARTPFLYLYERLQAHEGFYMLCFTLSTHQFLKKYALSIYMISSDPLPGESYSLHFASEDTGFREVKEKFSWVTALSGGVETGL